MGIPDVKVLSMNSSVACGHLFRVLYPNHRILYVDIPPGVFEDDTYVVPPDIMRLLPEAISEDVNYLDIGPGFSQTLSHKTLRGITPWHGRSTDILQLPVVAEYNPFMFETLIDGLPAVVKFSDWLP
jgi:hypothetical protein